MRPPFRFCTAARGRGLTYLATISFRKKLCKICISRAVHWCSSVQAMGNNMEELGTW
jgi:hypothetical protein